MTPFPDGQIHLEVTGHPNFAGSKEEVYAKAQEYLPGDGPGNYEVRMSGAGGMWNGNTPIKAIEVIAIALKLDLPV
jgi:hypothetical protein